jgi:predicted pyridoxine 5'-phosphate oxidase superfamily flavin-nucleotide-binding protein
MAKFYDTITETLREFIEAQHLFFVATAPLTGDGHVNLSPKGLDSFRVLSPNRVAYMDMIGSGNETSAHLHENGRITFMFCAFEGRPNIVRLFGRGHTVLPDTPEWELLAPQFTLYRNTRQIIVADVHQAQTSCGFAVPLYDYVSERDTLVRWADTQSDDDLETYKATKNARSIDGLLTPIGAACE